MEIYAVSASRSFTCQLHFAVYDSTDYLVAASFAGLDTSVRAISAAVIEGRNINLLPDKLNQIYLHTYSGGYRRTEKQANGPIVHGVVLSKDAAFDENSPTPVVLAPDGDLRSAVGRFMAARYALPKEWLDQYFDLMPLDGIEELEVLVNPLNQNYKDLKAIKISSEYANEGYILNEIDTRLKNGQLVIPPVEAGMQPGQFDPAWSMKEYLTNNAGVLAEQLKNVRPRHVPGVDPLDPAIAEMTRLPFPAQAHMIQALYNTLKYQDSVFAGADMGCGKSIMSLGVAHLVAKLMHKDKIRKGQKGMSVLLVAPGITIPKWMHKEIGETLPDAKVRVLSSTDDAARYAREVKQGYRPEGLEFVLVGLDRSKLGPEPWTTAVWKRVAGTKTKAWHCPDCGEPLLDPDGDEEGTLAFWNTLAYGDGPEKEGGYFEIHDIPKCGSTRTILKRTTNNLPVGYEVRWDKNSHLKECQHCSAKLRRPALKSRGETNNKPRYFISRILKGLRKHFDLFICDEVHQTKAEDSGRGDAFAQMVKSAKKMLFLTGTLVNGKSTSIKEILWRTDPGALLKEGFNHKSGMVAWASRYGVLKKITKVTEEDTGLVTRRKRVQLQPVEEPGIAPQMVAQFLLHKVAFMELGDLNLPLVNIVEKPIFIDMDTEHQRFYSGFHYKLHSACKQAMAQGFKGAFSKFIPATICYGDRPDLGAAVAVGGEIVVAPKLDYVHAKERELIKLVKKELSEDRGVIIGLNYTDSYACHIRIRDVLKCEGIESHLRTSSVPSEKRVEWLAKKEAEGAKVIITNIKLVEVGLDLIPWSSIFLYQLSYDVNIVRQFARRNWRIESHRESRIYYLVYNGSQQMAQFLNVMAKRSAAMLAEGRLGRSELSQYCQDTRNTMAYDLANCLADAKVAAKWTELARKELDANLKLVDESNFQGELKKAMTELVAETKRLCGVIVESPVVTPAVHIEDKEKPTIFDMWETLKQQTSAPKRRKRIMPATDDQVSLFDFGMGA